MIWENSSESLNQWSVELGQLRRIDYCGQKAKENQAKNKMPEVRKGDEGIEPAQEKISTL